MTVSALLFDLGQTLLDYGPQERWPRFRIERMAELYPLVCELCGRPALSPSAFGDLVGGALQTDELRAREHSGLSRPFAERMRQALAAAGITPDGHRLEQLAEAFHAPVREWPRPYPETAAALAGLRALGLKMAIITNAPWDCPGRMLYADLERWDLRRFFDAFVGSGEVPWRKPNPEFMWAAARALTTPPEQCLVVGDSLMADIGGARAAGMYCVWINRDAAAASEEHPRPDRVARSLSEVSAIIQGRGG